MDQFNYQLYFLLYPDLGENGIITEDEATIHWNTFGKHEKRISTLKQFIKEFNFDYSFYIKYYDLKHIKDEKEAVFYWLKTGRNQNQVCNVSKKKKEIFKVDKSNIRSEYFRVNNKRNFLEHLREQKPKFTFFKIKTSKDICKGVNIDQDIISEALLSLKFSNQRIEVIDEQDFSWLANNKSNNEFKISLKSNYYVFSEIILFDLCQYLLANEKKVIIIPNIDSYETFDSDQDWFANLKTLSADSNFQIWSKTKQIYDWIHNLGVKNNKYLNFIFYRSKLKLNDSFIDKGNRFILLDTGSSLSNRKYINEIANIFHRYYVGFKLVIKTVPIVYQKKELHLYEQSPNITIVNELMSMSELDKFYEKFGYIIYLSKFDGFGLSLSKAMSNNMFIFAGNGLPWSELLEYYPRKCLINMEQDFSKRIGKSRRGFARSQIYYKCDFSDLIKKLKFTYLNQDKDDNNLDEIIFFNWINKYIFLSNLYQILNAESYYKKSSVHMCSYKDRSIIVLENIVSILFQSKNINIYLNSSHRYSLHFLKKMNNVTIIPFCRDMKALSKLYCLCKSKSLSTYNFIIDDDIIYPFNYIIYSARVINEQQNPMCVFSYNGFYDKYKLSFMKKHHRRLNGQILDTIGTGTIFYKNSNLINKKKLLEELESCNNKDGIFADKFLSDFLEKEHIPKCYFNIPSFGWMINNPKISLNHIPGLYEYKIKHNLIDSEFISTGMDEEISIYKFLYYIEDLKKEEENEILQTSRLIKLSSLVYFKIIYSLKYLHNRFPTFDYLIIDNKTNINSINSPVEIINLKNCHFKNNNELISPGKFIKGL